jgi:hypothetical protein
MKSLIVGAIGALPFVVLAASSENYALDAQQANVAGASSSPLFHVESMTGSTLEVGRAAGAAYAIRNGLRADARFDRSGVTLAAHPARAIVGQPLMLRAIVASGASRAGAVRFTEDGNVLAGCDAVPMQSIAEGSLAAGVGTCRIDAAKIGSHHYSAQFSQPGDGIPSDIALDVDSTADVATDFTDLWWGGIAQNGWGISIAQHGAIQFNVLYTYDASGKPVWFVMPGGTWDATHTIFSGALYEPTSAPFDAYVASRINVGAGVGTASIRFTSAGTAQLDYVINGVAGSKAIERQPIAVDAAGPRLQVNDMWWAGQEQTGWGINIAQQDRMLFATWFSYAGDGVDTWFVLPGGSWSGTSFTGDLYASTSSPWLGTAYSPAAFAPVKVGSMTLDFTDTGFATMTYTVRGITQSKTIVRQPY